MPALFLFHRRTLLGGDDLQPAAFATMALRCFQLLFLLGPIFHHIARESRDDVTGDSGLLNYMLYDPNGSSDIDACRHSHYFGLLLVAYSVASALYGVYTLVLEWRISYWSSQGSPTETEPRTKKLALLLEYKLIPLSIVLFLIWIAGVSTLFFARAYYSCLSVDDDNYAPSSSSYEFSSQQRTTASFASSRKQLWWFALALLLLSQIAEVLFSWAFLISLCRQPKANRLAEASWHDSEMEFYLSNQHELVVRTSFFVVGMQ
jgi:hypothetical protein